LKVYLGESLLEVILMLGNVHRIILNGLQEEQQADVVSQINPNFGQIRNFS
jgi:hypothetical protein